MGLKGVQRRAAFGKSRLEMFNGLQKRIGSGTGRGKTNAAQERAKDVQALAQEMNQPVKRAL
jgi:hypothetical protein